jgi:hypothetical protein
MALLATHPQEALIQPSALEIRLELLLDEIRQRPVGRGAQLTECGIVLLDELVQQRSFRPMPGIAARIDERRGLRLPRTGDGGHGGRSCNGRGRNRLFRQDSRRTPQICPVR